jgi:CheY-like chemotaxis protein
MSNTFALVIEDDFDAAVIFAKALEVLGFQTETIHDGKAALERIAQVVPEIVTLDLHLPNVVGGDILRQIRADARLVNTRVIVATADPRSADLIQPIADLVLLKPTTFSQVRDLAARLVSMPRTQSKRFATTSS